MPPSYSKARQRRLLVRLENKATKSIHGENSSGSPMLSLQKIIPKSRSRGIAEGHQSERGRAPVYERSGGSPGEKLGVAQHVLKEEDVGFDAADVELVQRPLHLLDGMQVRPRPHYHLRSDQAFPSLSEYAPRLRQLGLLIGEKNDSCMHASNPDTLIKRTLLAGSPTPACQCRARRMQDINRGSSVPAPKCH